MLSSEDKSKINEEFQECLKKMYREYILSYVIRRQVINTLYAGK